jgi:hypothetical protein
MRLGRPDNPVGSKHPPGLLMPHGGCSLGHLTMQPRMLKRRWSHKQDWAKDTLAVLPWTIYRLHTSRSEENS